MKTEYEKQAADFLARYGLTLRINRAKDKPPAWVRPGEPHGNRYRVTVSHPDRTPLRFDFHGSIADKERGEDPTPYDVLACIASDVWTPDTFHDFCSSYGYDEDSRRNLALFSRCDRFARSIRAFFPDGDEREALCEIA